MNAVKTPELWLHRILLHGGPEDGKELVVSNSILEYGSLVTVALVQPFFSAREFSLEDAIVPVEKHIYVRKNMSAGKIGTCEFRSWYEWHYDERLSGLHNGL